MIAGVLAKVLTTTTLVSQLHPGPLSIPFGPRHLFGERWAGEAFSKIFTFRGKEPERTPRLVALSGKERAAALLRIA